MQEPNRPIVASGQYEPGLAPKPSKPRSTSPPRPTLFLTVVTPMALKPRIKRNCKLSVLIAKSPGSEHRVDEGVEVGSTDLPAFEAESLSGLAWIPSFGSEFLMHDVFGNLSHANFLGNDKLVRQCFRVSLCVCVCVRAGTCMHACVCMSVPEYGNYGSLSGIL